MPLQSSFLSRLALLALSLPLAAFATTAISVNGTCDLGTCTPAALAAGALTIGTSSSSAFSIPIVLADNDEYTLSGSYNNTFPSGTTFGFYPTVTYTGNSVLGNVSAVATDTLSVNMLQDYFFPGLNINWDGTYTENIPFLLSAANSSATGYLSVDGQNVGTLGSVSGPVDIVLSKSTPLTGVDGNTLVIDYNLTFTFDGGTTVGSGSGSPSIPEPVQTIPVALTLLALLALTAFQNRDRKGSVN
jgi:hypothetical protein